MTSNTTRHSLQNRAGYSTVIFPPQFLCFYFVSFYVFPVFFFNFLYRRLASAHPTVPTAPHEVTDPEP